MLVIFVLVMVVLVAKLDETSVLGSLLTFSGCVKKFKLRLEWFRSFSSNSKAMSLITSLCSGVNIEK